MTITAQTSKTGPYSGNGTTTVFSYTFEVQDEGDLVVTLRAAWRRDGAGAEHRLHRQRRRGNASGGRSR